MYKSARFLLDLSLDPFWYGAQGNSGPNGRLPLCLSRSWARCRPSPACGQSVCPRGGSASLEPPRMHLPQEAAPPQPACAAGAVSAGVPSRRLWEQGPRQFAPRRRLLRLRAGHGRQVGRGRSRSARPRGPPRPPLGLPVRRPLARPPTPPSSPLPPPVPAAGRAGAQGPSAARPPAWPAPPGPAVQRGRARPRPGSV